MSAPAPVFDKDFAKDKNLDKNNNDKVAQLRDAFDRAYAAPPPSQSAEQIESLLSIELAGNPYALRVHELSALLSNKKVVAVPSPVPELIGISGVRGGIVPVYSFAMVLGHARDDHERWLALCGSEEPIGFVFGDLQGYIRIPLAHFHAATADGKNSEYIKHVVRTAGNLRPVISMPSLVKSIAARCDKKRASEEQ